MAAALFTGVGDLPGGFFSSNVNAVSADGSTVMGFSQDTIGDAAFRWTRAQGMVPMGLSPEGRRLRYATDASADGSVIVGHSYANAPSALDARAFRWTASGGAQDIGLLPSGENSSLATGVSAEGNVVVGYGYTLSGSTFGPSTAFRWTQAGGFEPIPNLLPTHPGTWALDVSADGGAVVGLTSSFYDGAIAVASAEAFRWTEAGGTIGLGDLSGGEYDSEATSISADGAIVVGRSKSDFNVIVNGVTNQFEAFRWTETTGMVGLGALPVSPGIVMQSEALAISPDGHYIVGDARLGDNTEAVYWRDGQSAKTVRSLLESAGLQSSLAGWTLFSATGVSTNGRTIVGYGLDPAGKLEGWVAIVPEPTSAQLAVFALASLLASGARAKRRAAGCGRVALLTC
jgi:uncharacterized membrane protein